MYYYTSALQSKKKNNYSIIAIDNYYSLYEILATSTRKFTAKGLVAATTK